LGYDFVQLGTSAGGLSMHALKPDAVLARAIKPAVAQEQISQGFAMDLKRSAKLRRGAVIATENEARCEGLFTGGGACSPSSKPRSWHRR
jgi:hypothetical protein